jgi:hypothetical protein
MKKAKLILALFAIGLIISSPCYAQEWARTYGGSGDDIGYCSRNTADGGYIVAGFTETFDGGAMGTSVSK